MARVLVPNHPYASYETVADRNPRLFWIVFYCSYCGDVSRKQCSDPARLTHWVLVYASQHSHGLQPRIG